MVKLCAHHQEQFAHVLNNLCTEEQFTLSEKNTPISDDQCNGCTCHEGNAKASTAPLLHHVITKAETKCAFEISHRGQLDDCAPRLFQTSLIPEEKSADNIITLANCAVFSRTACPKQDENQSIKSDEETSLRLEDCAPENPEKEVRMNDEKPRDSPQCTDTPKLEDQEYHLDSHECDIKDPRESSSHSIVMSKTVYCLKEPLLNTFVPFQEKDLVPTEKKPFLQDIRQFLTSSTPSVGDSYKPHDALTIDQTTSECHIDVLIPKCESVPEIASVAQLEEIDLERKPSEPSPPSCPENVAHAIINGTSTCCPLSHAVNNPPIGHSEVGIKASNGLGVENKDVFSPEDHVQEGTAVNPRVGVNCVNLVSHKKEPVSPSVDLFIETKSTISVCDAPTGEFNRDQSPLKTLPEKPLALEDPSVRVLSPAFLCSNGIDEQRFHLPVCLSDLKDSNTLTHGETSTVVKNLETEDLKTTTLSSLGNINTNDYPVGNSSELSPHKRTQALKPLHDKLNCNLTHSINTDTCKDILVNCANTCTESSHAEIPVENKSYFSPLETDTDSVSVTPDSLPPPQETEQFDHFEGKCGISAFKENSNLQVNPVEADLEISKKMGKNASSNETGKLRCSTHVAINPEVLEKKTVACSGSEEKITFNSQVHDCFERIEITNIRANARTRLLSKKFSTLTPSDRRLRSRVFPASPAFIPPVQAPKCTGAKNVNTIAYGMTSDNLSADGGDNNVSHVCKALDDTKSVFDEHDARQSPNSMQPENNAVVSDSLLVKKENKPCDRTRHQEHKNDLPLRNKHLVPNIPNSDISINASFLEKPSNSDWETQSRYVSRNTLIAKKHTQSKSVTKPKVTTSENYNLRTSTSATHTNPKRLTKTENCIKIAALKAEETFGNAELSGPAKETERPKFVYWCCEEDDQERISDFSSKYVSVHKTWIPVEKEGTVPHRPKNRADKLKEIWKTKKRTRKNKSALEASKYSSIQTLFMNSAKFSDVCQWFVESTETKSLVIVKKLNTRLPGDLSLPAFPLHKYPASSLYPHLLQAQRLKKYLKKFASVVPAHNNHKLQTALSKLKESGDVKLHGNLDGEDIVQGTNACRARKAKGNVSKPVTDQILRKYNNCRRKSLLKSSLVRPEKKEQMINTVETKRRCSNLSIKMSLSRLASAVDTDSRSPGSPTVEKRHNGRKHFKDSSGKLVAVETRRRCSNPSTKMSSSTLALEVDTDFPSPGTPTMEKGCKGRKRPRESSGIVDTPRKKKRREASTRARNNPPTTNQKADSRSRALKKPSEKHTKSKTPQTSTSKKRQMNKNRSCVAQVVKHKMKTRQSKSVKQKQSSTTPVTPTIAKRVVRSQRVSPRGNSTSGPAGRKKGVKHKPETRKPRSKTDCPTQTKRRSLESK